MFKIPDSATEQERVIAARSVGNPAEMATHTFLSCMRQERLLIAIEGHLARLAEGLGAPADKPQGADNAPAGKGKAKAG